MKKLKEMQMGNINRRDFRRNPFLSGCIMKILVAGTGALTFLPNLVSAAAPPEAAKRPNILILLTDDQRWDAMGCAGNRIVQTPEMDRLAREGTRFVNAFVTSSICAASRASIFTGQYERSHHCNFNTGALRRAQLEQSYPMQLRRAGYHTGFIGKYGVGDGKLNDNKREIEGKDVFDSWYGFYGLGVYYSKTYPGKHLTEVTVEQARDFLDRAPSGKPWCLSISFKAPHSGKGYLGYEPEPDLKNLYADVTVPPPPTAKQEYFDALPEFLRRCNARTNYWEQRFSTPGQYQAVMKDYYRLITGADRAIGRIRAELARRGLADNTVIIFLSDNGDMMGDYMLGGKELLYDASLRVPLTVFDPRVPQSARGRQRTELALNIDIAPTVLDLAGAPVPAAMQGRSLAPLVRGKHSAWRRDFFCENDFCIPGQYYPMIEGVRTARWKYVRYTDVQPVYEQLFDLDKDANEVTNLARERKYAATLTKLRRRCDQLRAGAAGAPVRKESATATSVGSFPEAIECVVQPFYRHRPDGKPGREIILNFKGPKFSGKGTIELDCPGGKETIQLDVNEGIDHLAVLLPPGIGVKSGAEAKIIFRSAGHELLSSVTIPAKRQWTVYIYPHSHVDIGYTNTQANVKIIHGRDLINGIELAKKTAGYPEGARYLWNPEVLWPVERYLKTATPEERAGIIDAVQKGYLRLDAGYVNVNTSATNDEGLFEFFRQSKELEKLTGRKIETLVQVDVPGMSWGVIPVAAKLGIRYCFKMNNAEHRIGFSPELSFKPFWWLGPDGKSKILFLQPGGYNPGALAKGHAYGPLMLGQTDPSKIIQIVKTGHPRENFIDGYLAGKLPELERSDYYPYDIFAMTWAMGDNAPIDADLPDAVKSWNEEYAFPHLIIAGATDIMRAFEKKYGNQLPVLKGDFTEYWTDGLGSAAKQTGMNRSSKERLIQAGTLWTMLHPGEPAPRSDFNEAWRNVIMGDEHTYCFAIPAKQPISNDILNVKFGYFQEAENLSKSLLDSALSSVTDTGSSIVGVFNTLSWPRSGLVSVPALQSKTFSGICDEKGKTIISQRLSTGELVFLATGVPALGSKNYFLKNKKSKSTDKLAQGNTLDNGIVRVVIDPQTGDISSLTSSAYEFVDPKAACALNSYRYLHGDDSPDKATGTKDVKITIKENGPLMATLLVESGAEGCNSLSREVTIIAGGPFVEITNIVDKQAILNKEGIHFGFAFNIPGPITRFDIPWGVVELEKDQLPGANRNWITFQRWLDISNNERGVTWCSLDAPVFESGNMTANILGKATNSPQWIRRLQPSATIYSWALNNHWYTNFPLSQEGKVQFRYRILPHSTKYDAALSNRFGLEQSQPLIASPVKVNFHGKPILAIDGDNRVVISSIFKTGNNGKTDQVRLRSVSNKDELVKLDWPDHKPSSVYIGDFVEGPVKKEVQEEVLVPAMGSVTLNAVW